MGNRQVATEFFNAAVSAANDKTQPVHLQTAYQLFASAVHNDATFGQGWYALGNANGDLNMLHAAIAAYRRGLVCELDPDMRAKMMVNLGWRLYTLGQVDEARELIRDALHSDSTLASGWLNLGLVYGVDGLTDWAVEHMRKAVALAPDDMVARAGLAFALLFNGDYHAGFKEFECRFEWKLHHFLKYPYPKWNGEPDKTVFLVADQGLGDTLSFARFVEPASKRAKFLHILVQAELMRPFLEAWAHLPNINLMPLASPFLAADAWSTFVSLPYALGFSTQEVIDAPQIKMPVYALPTTWMAPDARFHIGIAWAGSPLNEIDAYRNIPVTEFLELYRVPGIQLYSLQVGDRAKDLQHTGTTGLIRDLSGHIRDVTDTTALLRDLDLVICCESALGHICASVGKECWIPYSLLGNDYRLGRKGEKLLWTPRHRVFQQGMDQQWGPVFKQIVEALREKVYGTEQKAAPRRARV